MCAVADEYVVVSDGVNVAVSCCVPGPRTVPAGGLKEKVPATFAVAFNCAALRAVPNGMAAGGGQVITGVVCVTVGGVMVSCTVDVAAE